MLPLLEVGSGFHDDLTGRENVQLLGAVLDMDPDLLIVGIGAAWTIVLAALGWYVFARLEVTFADVI